MTDALLFALTSLAAYRLARLVTRDEILEQPRAWLERRLGRFANGLACAWCAGSWCAFATVAIVDAIHGLALPVLWAGAVATVVGLLSELDNA